MLRLEWERRGRLRHNWPDDINLKCEIANILRVDLDPGYDGYSPPDANLRYCLPEEPSVKIRWHQQLTRRLHDGVARCCRPH